MTEWEFVDRPEPADGAWRLFQACRLIEKKGIDVAIRAFAEIHQRFPNATFRIAGEGPLLEPMEQMAAELGIADAVQFVGFLDQVGLKREMAEAHVFVHPSRIGADGNQEGVPNSMLEAMASGLPVVATHHGGIPEAVEHGVSGWLVQEDDWEGLASGLLSILQDDALRRRLANGAREGVEAKFSRQSQIEALERNYGEVLRQA